MILVALVTVAVARKWLFSSRQQTKSSLPKVLVVLSDGTFDVPSAAAAAKTFQKGGRLQVVLSTPSGRATTPDAESLRRPAAITAADRQDKAWLRVIRGCEAPMAFAKCRAPDFAAVYVSGGPRMLRDLNQVELSGRTPTPFAKALRTFAENILEAGGVVGAVGHGVHGVPSLPSGTHTDGDGGSGVFVGRLDSDAEKTAESMLAALSTGLLAETWAGPGSGGREPVHTT